MESKFTADIRYGIRTKCTCISGEYAIFDFVVIIGIDTELASGNLIINRGTTAYSCEFEWNNLIIVPEEICEQMKDELYVTCMKRLSYIG